MADDVFRALLRKTHTASKACQRIARVEKAGRWQTMCMKLLYLVSKIGSWNYIAVGNL